MIIEQISITEQSYAADQALRAADFDMRLVYGSLAESGSQQAVDPKLVDASFACLTSLRPVLRLVRPNQTADEPIDWSAAPPPEGLDPNNGGIFAVHTSLREAILEAHGQLLMRAVTESSPTGSLT